MTRRIVIALIWIAWGALAFRIGQEFGRLRAADLSRVEDLHGNMLRIMQHDARMAGPATRAD
jgi:hypothetical protein